MPDTLDPLSDRACRMTDAYSTGIEVTEQLQAGNSLPSSVAESTIRTDYLDDGYPKWHPAPHSFLGMVRLVIYREITGDSYRALARYQELAESFDLEHTPDESVLSRTWRNRFDDGVLVDDPVHEYVFWFYLTSAWEMCEPLYVDPDAQPLIEFVEIRDCIRRVEPLLQDDTMMRVRVDGHRVSTSRPCELSGRIVEVRYGGETTGASASLTQLVDQAAIVIETDEDTYVIGGRDAVIEDVLRGTVSGPIDFTGLQLFGLASMDEVSVKQSG